MYMKIETEPHLCHRAVVLPQRHNNSEEQKSGFESIQLVLWLTTPSILAVLSLVASKYE